MNRKHGALMPVNAFSEPDGSVRAIREASPDASRPGAFTGGFSDSSRNAAERIVAIFVRYLH